MAQASGVRRLDASLIQDAWADLQQLPPPWQEHASQQAAKPSTIIEFGQLDEEEDHELASTALLPDPISSTTTEHVELEVQQQPVEPLEWSEASQPAIEAASDTNFVDSDAAQTMVICGLPGADMTADWIEGLEFVDELPPEHRASNPFEDDFEEEVVVIDRDAAWEIEAFRGRPRVTCGEGRQMAAQLHGASAGNEPYEATQVAPNVVQERPTSASAFEYTTLQMAVEEVSWMVDTALSDESIHHAEADLDEEIDCVPLPWTRGNPVDDRDVIIIEEDTPLMNLVSEESGPTGQSRRIEYRELFAQLRRATP